MRKGLYILAEGLPDEYALLQSQSSKAVFSYSTALFMWGLSDRTPHFLDITLPHGTNVSRLKRDNPNLRCHYVQMDLFELGITDTRSPQGGTVRLYDWERCICDLIRDKEQMELQLFTQAVTELSKRKHRQANEAVFNKHGQRGKIISSLSLYLSLKKFLDK